MQKAILWLSDNAARPWLIGINLILMVCGALITILGIVGIAETSTIQESAAILEWFNLLLLAWAVFITGILLSVTAFAGFWGAYNTVTSFLKMYTFILFLVFCLELGIGIYLASIDVDVLSSFWFEDTELGLVGFG
jgi:hypothetical protein